MKESANCVKNNRQVYRQRILYALNDKKPIEADKKPIEADKKPIKIVRQETVLQFVRENGSIGNNEARELLGLAESTVKRILKEMVKEDLLILEGERKARKYLLKMQ